MISGLDLVFLEVNNLEESVEFYRDVLGFSLESDNMDSQPPTRISTIGLFADYSGSADRNDAETWRGFIVVLE